ncbi:MAG: SPOR domain-containing protein [Gammaproteobacteria bacterium]|nr:MAG: SPOR domain-containing protein [Gammaproteobacteria bacterium]TLY77704.1 MAG: SPOR domain-containing protein [Gammaproteobacteria bacterium]
MASCCSASPRRRVCEAVTQAMARLTTRDYKSAQRRALDFGRLREFGAGVLVGAVLASALFVYMGGKRLATQEAAEEPRPEPQRVAPEAADPTAAGTGQAPEKYDFYEMLPNFEVVVPEKDKEVKRDLPATARIERPGVYVLQAGSYRNQSDADRVRAQLALQGIDAKVQRVAVDADVWHRVRIGPVTRLEDLNKLRKQLQAAEIDALVIRVGD